MMRVERQFTRLEFASGRRGLWFGNAQWPSAETRDTAFALASNDSEASRLMRESIAQALPGIGTESIADFLQPLARGSS